MKKLQNLFLGFFLTFSLLVPFLSYAQNYDAGFGNGGSNLVPCGTDRGEVITENGKETADSRKILNPCGFDDILAFINNTINFLLFKLALPVSAMMFAYAGFLLITSGGEANKKTHAKEIFWNVAIGLIIAAASFVIVNTVLSIAGYTGDWTHF